MEFNNIKFLIFRVFITFFNAYINLSSFNNFNFLYSKLGVLDRCESTT